MERLRIGDRVRKKTGQRPRSDLGGKTGTVTKIEGITATTAPNGSYRVWVRFDHDDKELRGAIGAGFELIEGK